MKTYSRPGTSIAPGAALFRKGALLRPQDIGVLAALGIVEVEVTRAPRVALISTGDELVPVEIRPLPPGKVRDINSFSLAALIESAGARIGMREMVSDRLEDQVSVCREAVANHDAVVLSGGSSVGVRDYTARVLSALPESELLVHGVAIRPGKPTIFGLAGGALFWGTSGSARIRADHLPGIRASQSVEAPGYDANGTSPGANSQGCPQPSDPFGARQNRLFSGFSFTWNCGRVRRPHRYSGNPGRSAYWPAPTDMWSFPNTWRVLTPARKSPFSSFPETDEQVNCEQ